MGRSKKLKHIHSIFKDKAKIIKAKFSITNHTTSAIQIAVLRSTTRSARSPPPDHLISALVSFSNTTRHSALACISTIINRLHHHHQPNVYVALKCLITLHHMFIGGSFVLDEQVMMFQSMTTASYGFLNLSRFVDNTNMQSREFSLWAQWYACFLETSLFTSTVLKCHVSLSKHEFVKKKESLKSCLYIDLFREIEALVSTVEEICKVPKSLHCQKNDIIYEVTRLVGEDYRMIQYHIMIRLTELSDRVHNLSTNESSKLIRCLERLETCKAGLSDLFSNRMRNEAFWDLVTELMVKLMKLKEGREVKSLCWKMIEYETESTQFKQLLVLAT
ncbi:hypothetical protein QVD17_38336 [Tagetes erecta]|uniref:ENTH domain-containing protein n=1 Tax=Tagetes erecta TaxID=13708 RepID=A0AAD8NG51_TARER|nr:hypothetical protein QVD17_38336 [Tagetes erecta]